MNVSACMIVRDGEDTLERALSSLKGYVDEIVVAVDSRTTDKTREIVERFTPRIWCPTNPDIHPPDIKTFEYEWTEDFSQSRNLAASRATNDIILVIDADDAIEPGKQDIFRQALTEGEGMRFTINTGIGLSIKSIRCYNRKHARYIYAIHEYLQFTKSDIEPVVVDVPITINHAKGHIVDPGRNLRILESKLLEYPRYLFYYGREKMHVAEWDEARLSFEKYLDVSTWTPERAEATLSIARCYLMLENLPAAKDYCHKTILIDPNFAPAYDTLGQIAAVEQDYHSAIRWYQNAVNCQDTHYIFSDGNNMRYHSLIKLAEAYRAVGDVKEANRTEKKARAVKVCK